MFVGRDYKACFVSFLVWLVMFAVDPRLQLARKLKWHSQKAGCRLMYERHSEMDWSGSKNLLVAGAMFRCNG
jgi:hypothetical protein